MYDIVIEYAPQLNMEEAFTMMTKDSRWKEVAVQIKCELNFCLKAEIAPDFFHKLISLDLKQPDILKSDDFKLLVKYAVNFYFLHPNIVGNQPVLTILKKAAQTDTETLIKRLEQATNIEAITPSNRLVDLLKNILAKEDKLKWAWFRYASTLDCQPLNWNTATMLSTIYSEEELDSAVVEVSSEVKDSPEFKVFLVALEDDSNDALQKCAK
ncbi:uncharacterized protein PHALS_09775 [Plasmopara halstedii]|uniref:Uncharacterized protein n=1 Tax=Plasmopara halstedii TaxID=4781 RepID=A0A0P1AEP1_PLAHL|nr:uncharacterized protein PHALS_09775 [Plasmopara halstedii]CEG39533.1 hypothetical protein PHALS_09775 [Plasmopara halstedii]|eukprot:XP_024575902.1 hypothetical protein PHALS_09775 [Plasmopara halstedii]